MHNSSREVALCFYFLSSARLAQDMSAKSPSPTSVPFILLIGTVGNSSCLCGFFFFLSCSRFLSSDPRKKHPLDAFLLLQNSQEAELESSVFSFCFCSLNVTDHMQMEIVTLNAIALVV